MKLIDKYFEGRNIRESILSIILFIYVICINPLFVISHFWYVSIGSNDTYILLAVALSVNLLFIMKNRLDVRLNSFFVSIITFLLGVAVFLSNGFNSVAPILFLTASMIAAINIGRMTGVIFHGASVVFISLIITLSQLGLHRFDYHSSEVYSLNLLLIILVNYAVIVLALVIIVGYLYEETKQKVDRDLANQLNLYHSFMNSLPGIFYVMTLDRGKLVQWNSQLSLVTGYTEKELKNLQFQNLIKEKRESQFQNISKTIEQKGMAEFEEDLLTKENKTVPYYFSNVFARIHGQDCITGVGLDISRRKEAEEQLRHTQKMDTIGVLAGGIAHDFNNILSAIMGYAELAQLRINSEKDVSSSLESILKASERARGLIHQILIFSRKMSNEIADIDLIVNFRDFSRFFRSSVSSAIDLQFHYGEEPLFIRADPTHIHQILLNLGVNAQHAVKDKKDGSISLSLESVEIPDKGHFACIRVTDNGKGIPDESVNKIFDPFFTTKPQGEGTGMGLSVVHGIVEDYKGTIEVESRAGQGTSFTVYLPLLEEHEITPPAEIPDLSKHIKMGNGELLMIIDDDESLLSATSQLIELLGFEPVPFLSSTEALEELISKGDQYLLVISDQVMPGLKGLDLIKAIRSRGIGVPVILNSGYSETLTRESALAGGASAFFHKPVELNLLADEIKKHMTAKNPEA